MAFEPTRAAVDGTGWSAAVAGLVTGLQSQIGRDFAGVLRGVLADKPRPGRASCHVLRLGLPCWTSGAESSRRPSGNAAGLATVLRHRRLLRRRRRRVDCPLVPGGPVEAGGLPR